jgi:hypothetical protein
MNNHISKMGAVKCRWGNSSIHSPEPRKLGENTYQFCSPALTERAFERMVVETDLKFALQLKEFVLFKRHIGNHKALPLNDSGN